MYIWITDKYSIFIFFEKFADYLTQFIKKIWPRFLCNEHLWPWKKVIFLEKCLTRNRNNLHSFNLVSFEFLPSYYFNLQKNVVLLIQWIHLHAYSSLSLSKHFLEKCKKILALILLAVLVKYNSSFHKCVILILFDCFLIFSI